jgi:prolyl-tRNA synthetase
VYLPLFIPESLLQKEKDHVEGFAPEVAWISHGGGEPLGERMCVRPTSETLFCEHYAHIIHSYRDLPKLYNQWCSVVRWEKTTRPFLRHREFLWQEGHTIHATAEEADAEALAILELYRKLAEEVLAMPVIKGPKTDSEKFAGAVRTYAIESMMHDGRGLQAGTTHFFGDGFAKAFGIQFTDRDNTMKHPHQSSWGISTRLLGGIIMTHGDDSGLILPPKIAPKQAVVVPVAAHKPGVREKAEELAQRLRDAGIRAFVDASDQSPGWKFAEHEMKGVPLRLELGPRDLENGVCMAAKRTGGDKIPLALDAVGSEVPGLLDGIQAELYGRALRNREARTFTAQTLDEMTAIARETVGFTKTMWCGSPECEDRVREATGQKSRCIPFEQEPLGDACVCCGRPAEKMIYWGLQY